MEMHYKQFGEGKPLVIVHGLFGSSDNWQTLGKRFAEKYEVFILDLRNHGRSPNTDEFSYDILADDIHRFFLHHNLKDAVLLGHSMGGKAAMVFAHKYEELLHGLIIADIGVKEYESHHDKILEGLNALNLEDISSRREADKEMKKYVPEFGVRQFLLKNLYRKERTQLDWRINIPVLEREMDEILRALDEVKDIKLPTLFIRGEKSNYIPDEDIPDLSRRFPNSEVKTLEGSGHWVHAEDPDHFYDLVAGFIDSLD